MKKQDKTIPVNFVCYTQYENFPTPVSFLGKISIKELEKIMKLAQTNTPAPDACIHSLNIKYIDRTCYGITSNNSIRHQSLDLDGMFYPDRRPHCGNTTKYCTDEEKIRRCALHLRNGKCHDALMRQIGAILYPQLYAKKKQK